MIEVFCICHLCQRHRWGTLSCEYLREFSKKIRNGPNGVLRAWGKLIHEKTRSRNTVPLTNKI
jgi:hypothetical protein